MIATQTRHAPNSANPHPQPDVPPPNGRGPDGRFARGNGFGLGNPFYRKQAEFRRAALELFTPEDVMSLLRVLLARGRQGDVAAAKVFLEYVVGKPHKAPDPDREEHHEWQLQAEAPRVSQVKDVLDRAVPPDMAADALRDTLPEAAYTHLCEAFAARNGPPPEPAAAPTEGRDAEPPEQPAEPTSAQRTREALRILTATLRAAVTDGENGGAAERCRQVLDRPTGADGGVATVPTVDDGRPPTVRTADDGGGRGAALGTPGRTGPNGAPGPRVM